MRTRQQIQVQRADEGLVDVVQVEHHPIAHPRGAVGPVHPEVLEVEVTTQHPVLVRPPGESRRVREHPVKEGCRAAEEREGRGGHAGLLAGEEHRHPPHPLRIAVQLPARELEGSELPEGVGHRSVVRRI